MAEEQKEKKPAAASAQPAHIPPRPPPVAEAKPILAGRLWIGVAMLVGIGLIANPKINQLVMGLAPPEDLHTDFTKWREDSVTEVRVTLITADSTRLSCASAVDVDGAHCEFGADHNLWGRGPNDPADDNRPNVIVPYRTSPDNALILLAGIWAQPEVAMRLHREPPGAIPVKRLQRFDVTCKVKFLKRLDSVDLRWDVGATWQTERGAWVARAQSCTVNNS